MSSVSFRLKVESLKLTNLKGLFRKKKEQDNALSEQEIDQNLLTLLAMSPDIGEYDMARECERHKQEEDDLGPAPSPFLPDRTARRSWFAGKKRPWRNTMRL
eukprot:TRINITY_DN6026_c0_g2_i1.p1 TRINITY_DN6026_c0_g2~~TRINITY_DN6026_c0_g2_i1.p1  ORF type:complete len:102 (+),score=19.30 TRINITY_DN6026_c0_g2_i1:44-349(+)